MSLNANQLFLEHALSLYVHYPFCVHKCPYCDFASDAQGQRTPEQAKEDAYRDKLYVDLLIAEFKHKLAIKDAVGDKRKFKSLYIGGGTPSLCEPRQLGRFLEFVGPYLDNDAEISMEANPGTVDAQRFLEFKAVGFNRLSIGVQSFNDQALKRLGRIHNSQEAIEACKKAKAAGFENFNIDLMHGLPRQDVELALYDLNEAFKLESTHLSWYELTLEEGTVFGDHPPVLPDESVLYEIEEKGWELLNKHGFKRYEVSGYAKGDEYRCVHNQNYWVYGDYMGLGAAAHQKMSYLDKDERGESIMVIKRGANRDSFKEYKQQFVESDIKLEDELLLNLGLKQVSALPLNLSKESAPQVLVKNDSTDEVEQGFFERQVSVQEIPFEFMLNRARLFDRVDAREYKLHTGLNMQSLKYELQRLSKKGLIELESDYSFTITKVGCIMLNQILEEFF